MNSWARIYFFLLSWGWKDASRWRSVASNAAPPPPANTITTAPLTPTNKAVCELPLHLSKPIISSLDTLLLMLFPKLEGLVEGKGEVVVVVGVGGLVRWIFIIFLEQLKTKADMREARQRGTPPFEEDSFWDGVGWCWGVVGYLRVMVGRATYCRSPDSSSPSEERGVRQHKGGELLQRISGSTLFFFVCFFFSLLKIIPKKVLGGVEGLYNPSFWLSICTCLWTH